MKKRATVWGLICLTALPLLLSSCKDKGEAKREAAEVVVYTSVDQLYAREIFDLFTQKTGIQVKAAFDTEATKTTGLFNRLMAEKDHPRADVFWNGEICRTLQLIDAGLGEDISDLVPASLPQRWVGDSGYWAAFSLRSRVIVYNTDLIKSPAGAPQTLAGLTSPEWKGKVAMANPQFGTTATHMAALYAFQGAEKTEQWINALKANDVRLVEGNGPVVDVVARGELPVGLTDTDDVFSGMEEGKPINFILPDQAGMGAFVIPNSVIRIKGGPNAEAARTFIPFPPEPRGGGALGLRPGPADSRPTRGEATRHTQTL